MTHEHPRVLVVDDGLLIREGIRQVLVDAGCEVVGIAGDAAQMMAALEFLPGLDAIILDIRMPPTFTDEGVRALGRWRSNPANPAMSIGLPVQGRFEAREGGVDLVFWHKA